MRTHYRLLSETKQQYRQMFRHLQSELESRLTALRSQYRCEQCEPETLSSLEQWLQPLHSGCGYTNWQRAALNLVENEIAADIVNRLNAIEAYKNTFNCHMCGMCCRMASADAPYEELQARAKAGDEFARQFTSIFLPYASREAAIKVAPDVVKAVLAEAGEKENDGERVYFYHCPYLGEDNRCSVYGTDKRPSICQSYPETPLSFVYEKCAWKPWKDETHQDTLAIHAMLALCNQYADTLRASLLAPEPAELVETVEPD